MRLDILMGLGDSATSPGCITLRDELRKVPNVSHVNVWTWHEWENAVADLKRAPSELHGAVGYSMGANTVTEVADALNAVSIQLDLCVSMDPTIWYGMWPLHHNVAEAICFHDRNPLNPVGHASVRCAPDFKGHFTTVNIMDLHLNVDTNEAYHQQIIKAVKAHLAKANGTE